MMRLVVLSLVVLISVSLSAGYRHRYLDIPARYDSYDDEMWYPYRQDYHPRRRLPIIEHEDYQPRRKLPEKKDVKVEKEMKKDVKVEKEMKKDHEELVAAIEAGPNHGAVLHAIEAAPGEQNPKTKEEIEKIGHRIIKLEEDHKKVQLHLDADYKKLHAEDPLAFDIIVLNAELLALEHNIKRDKMVLAVLLAGGESALPNHGAKLEEEKAKIAAAKAANEMNDGHEHLVEAIEAGPNHGAVLHAIEAAPGMQNPKTKEEIAKVEHRILKLEADHEKVHLHLMEDYKKLHTEDPLAFDIFVRHFELAGLEHNIKRDKMVLAVLLAGGESALPNHGAKLEEEKAKIAAAKEP